MVKFRCRNFNFNDALWEITSNNITDLITNTTDFTEDEDSLMGAVVGLSVFILLLTGCVCVLIVAIVYKKRKIWRNNSVVQGRSPIYRDPNIWIEMNQTVESTV